MCHLSQFNKKRFFLQGPSSPSSPWEGVVLALNCLGDIGCSFLNNRQSGELNIFKRKDCRCSSKHVMIT